MESERDALAKDLYEISVPGYKWEKVSPKAHKDFWLSQADELIKAGYRRVDAEHVLVRREHVRTLDDQRGFLWTLWDARSNSRNVDWEDADHYKALTDAMDALSAAGEEA